MVNITVLRGQLGAL